VEAERVCHSRLWPQIAVVLASLFAKVPYMNVKVRKIEVDARTADLLEARAAALGVSVSVLVAELAGNEPLLPPDLSEMRASSQGPWSSESLAEDERRLAEFDRTRIGVPWDDVKAWLQSWGTSNVLPTPRPRKL
jgi:hypothetical protein